jgi:hypothetical protein
MARGRRLALLVAAVVAVTAIPAVHAMWANAAVLPAKQVEDLDRGLISVRSGSDNLVSWRLLGTEALNTRFRVFRGSRRVATVSTSTNFLDRGAPAGATYTVRAVVNGVEQSPSAPALQFANGFLDVPLQVPPGGTTPTGEAYTYSANDASVGDLDGDGVLEFIVKWDPS